MLCCPGVTLCCSKQSLKWYEPPIDKQHKYEQNLKRIMRQSLVDVGLSIARSSDLLNDCIHCELHCYNTADADDLATQRTRSSAAIVLSHLTRNILISTQETLIFWENGLFNGSALQWRHNEGDGVSTHQPHDCLLNRLFRCRSNQTSKLRVTGLCEGNSPLTDRFGYKKISSEAWFDLQTKFPYRNHKFSNTFREILSHHICHFPRSFKSMNTSLTITVHYTSESLVNEWPLVSLYAICYSLSSRTRIFSKVTWQSVPV